MSHEHERELLLWKLLSYCSWNRYFISIIKAGIDYHLQSECLNTENMMVIEQLWLLFNAWIHRINIHL